MNICSSLNRYLNSPPHNRELNLMRDKSFQNANQVLSGVLKQLRESRLNVTRHKSAIAEGDIKKLYTSGVLGLDTPEALFNKVFVEISLYFGQRGREGLMRVSRRIAFSLSVMT